MITEIVFGVEKKILVTETLAGKFHQSVGDHGSFGAFDDFAVAGDVHHGRGMARVQRNILKVCHSALRLLQRQQQQQQQRRPPAKGEEIDCPFSRFGDAFGGIC